MVSLIIDGKKVEAPEGKTVLEVAIGAGIYIPHICAHPDLPSFDKAEPINIIYRGGKIVKGEIPSGTPRNDRSKKWEGCKLCVVEINGMLQTSCSTMVSEGMVVHTNTSEVQKARREALAKILAEHPHSCITCAQKEGCSLTQCSTNVPENERCCPKFGKCELQKVAEYIGVPADTPKYTYKDLPIIKDEPLFIRNFNLCIGCLRCVRMCKDIRGVGALGFVYSDDNKPIVGTVAPTLKESGCKFCGGCAEVCPTGAIMDKEPTHPREAFLLPCVHNCPIGIDVPRYIHYIAEHKFEEALSIIREKTPFPSILGHVCEHPCEANCRRGKLNEPISIRALKRFVAENQKPITKTQKPKTDKKVAVVGAGPAGLTAAYYLSKLGHSVTIFDSLSEPGGMMLSAIPRYRLPIEVLKKEISEVLSDGIEFKNNTTIGKDIGFEELKENYDAIFLAIGATVSKKLSIEGIEADGIFWGLDFLRSINLGTLDKCWVPPKVIVVGGGNVAIDVGLSCLRLGAKEVQLFCLEKWDEMPAYESEKEMAMEEGIIINCGWGPKRILHKQRDTHCLQPPKVAGIEFIRCTSVFDENGQFNPSFDDTETTSVSTEMVIMAIGQSPDLSILNAGTDFKPAITEQGTIKVNNETLEVHQIGTVITPGVFAGGDVVLGPASVVKAIEHGRRAAVSIDKYLGGDGNIVEVSQQLAPTQEYKAGRLGKEEGFADKRRVKMPRLEINKRISNFEQVELGLNESQAIEEANRCLRCDLRLKIANVVLPPSAWLEFNAENVNKVGAIEGVFQLLNEEKTIIYIKGTPNLKQELEREIGTKEDAKYFIYEEEPMFTKRESELIQHFLQVHGKMPKYNEELEDLF